MTFCGSFHDIDWHVAGTLINKVQTAPASWPLGEWLDEIESLICTFCLGMAAHKIEQIGPWDTLACCWDGKKQIQTTPASCPLGGGLGPVSWRPTTIRGPQSSQSNRHSTSGTQQTEYHEALPSSANDEVRCDCTFANDGNASWYSVCRVPMVEWRLDHEDCRHLTVVSLHDTGSRTGRWLNCCWRIAALPLNLCCIYLRSRYISRLMRRQVGW